MIATRHSLDDARVVHKEALSLLNAGHEVLILLSCNERFEYVRSDGSVIVAGNSPDGKCTHMGFNVIGLPKRSGLYGKFKTFLEVSKIAYDLKADVYHVHEPDLSLAIAVRTKHLLAKDGLKAFIVHDMHEYPPGGPADISPRFLKWLILLLHILLNKISMKWVDQIFTANSIVRGYALTLSFKMKVDVLYNGPRLKLFPQTENINWPTKEDKLIVMS